MLSLYGYGSHKSLRMSSRIAPLQLVRNIPLIRDGKTCGFYPKVKAMDEKLSVAENCNEEGSLPRII
jgi:hypothetical protein